ncbi:1-deoxy-D-xylulose-5-phosphate synthase [Psychrobacter sp. A3]|uniref:1-deoxy-D-xylulose-5-phosphate synthase n=1 Tax=Psychrobacter sp. A3 TaxID=2992754 RepID=UPI00237A3C71|nr:1-deoxy-D-xylulose-5-phosphate synthase [Psychrobacter sp. A3]MDE0491417.1 1-deoxy-D-xylulose-5-phosphate synthase [Psychrobacter sp. A3]
MQQSPYSPQSQSVSASATTSAVQLPSLQQTYTAIPRVRPQTPLLDSIDTPADLNAFSSAQLIALADELRLFLLYSAGQSGGHFGANLGVVELTIVLHYLLDAPHDQIVWDVGHQAYAHKVLTGRRAQLGSIRAKDGLTAFPERAESVYDTFGVGHSSTSISAGLGMSLALRYQGLPQTVACIIGDGAMTGGMAFEAMNDAVQQDADLLVILNDNDMSISCSIGGFSRHLAMLWESGYQVDISDTGQPIVCQRPDMQGFDRRKRHKEMRDVPQLEDNLFKAIGFTYFGPFDGHNIPELLRVLSLAKQVKGPVLVHIYTTKGKGFAPAELDPVGYHAISKLSDEQPHDTPPAAKKSQPALKYSQVFGQFLCDKAHEDDKLLAITPAMEEGSGMTDFARQFPERFFDVAIAEQHAVTLAAGMATQGVKPIVAIYSTFLQRGYDQLIHDVALQDLDVTFAIDRAGLVGEDGATHAGVFDFAFLRCVPNMLIAAPKDENECYHLLNTCYEYQGCTAVRYPRGVGTGAAIERPAQTYDIGKAMIESVVGQDDAPLKLALLAFGSMVAAADSAAQDIAQQLHCQVHVVNMRWVKPLDTVLLEEILANGITHIATLEEHMLMGGAGSAVNEYLLNESAAFKHHRPAICNIGIPDRFIAHGAPAEQMADCGLDVAGVVSQLKQLLK